MARNLESRPYTAWQLIKSYWQSDYRKSAYLFSLGIVLFTLAIVAMDVVFTYWMNYFYDSLQQYNAREAIKLLVIFFILATIYIVLQVYRYYVSQYFGLRWRRWLTEQIVNRWLQNRSYYYLEIFDGRIDNPDQRIQEDIGSLVIYSLNLATGLVSALATFFAFIYVLWQLSGHIHIDLGSWGTYNIHGYLVWVALVYCAIGSVLTIKIGRPLISLNFEQQRREATFRFAAVDLRSHAEDVALYRGEEHQKNILQRLFDRVLENWYFIILRQKLLLWFTAGFNQLSVALPLLVALPNYFSKVFELGGLIQSIRAFSSVQDALSFLINSYTTIAEWQAMTRRLITFLDHVYDAERDAAAQNQLVYHQDQQNIIQTKDLQIFKPNHEELLKNINQEFKHGGNYLIKGMSGVGKSTLIRTIAGIWPYAAGEIDLPQQQNIMYVPQKPYMPLGTFAEALMFPDKTHNGTQEDLQKILQAVGLSYFGNRLQDVAAWSQQLSPGEQQRVAFARVLIHQPDWVFLDESTSALDLNSEKELYQLLKTKLPNCSIISVGHRPSLDAYHENVVDLTQYSVQEQPA